MPGYISETDYDGGASSNFVEVVVPAGTDVSGYTLVVHDKDGSIIETFGLGAPTQRIAGQDVYLLDSTDPGWVDLHNDEALALVDDAGSVLQFVSFKDVVTATEGPAAGRSSTQIGEHSGSRQSLATSDRGATYTAGTTATPGTVPCFAPGTRIGTPDGPRAVETLRAGDAVLTRDAGPQPIRWIRRSEVALGADGAEGGTPVLIRAGAVAPGLPARDLVIRASHKVLLGGAGQFEGLLAGEALAPARALTALPRVRRMRGRRRAVWWHFALGHHAVVEAEGLSVESLSLGPVVMRGLSELETARLARLYPRARPGEALNGPSARPVLTVRQAEALLGVREIGALFGAAAEGMAPAARGRGGAPAR